MQITYPSKTIVQVVIPRSAVNTAVLMVGFALLTALAAQVKFHVPGTPVPITGQTFAVLLAGAALGSRCWIPGHLLGDGCHRTPVLCKRRRRVVGRNRGHWRVSHWLHRGRMGCGLSGRARPGPHSSECHPRLPGRKRSHLHHRCAVAHGERASHRHNGRGTRRWVHAFCHRRSFKGRARRSSPARRLEDRR